MNSDEYEKMARVETRHWFYVGKRQIARWAIERFEGDIADGALLDCGAGTGIFAQELSASRRVKVMDDHDESLTVLRQRFPDNAVVEGSCTAIPLSDASETCVTLLDVLEHVEDDRAAVKEFHRVLKPGGLLVITVPAMMQLWSDWDQALHHFRRYSRSGLAALFHDAQWEQCYLKYVNTAAFPAVWWMRRGRRSEDAVRQEDRLPPNWLNHVLRWLFVWPAVRRWCPAPFGVGLIIVLRKR
ncbi:class I SAM-dependent methyltransferase [Synoicihabitans lomoniglobus]|uniref:Class I SAM-dependent methyltransferase n=1 Tax=Synoicihabitans lomoniglobus TaxID=2909285 RepID=A0AAF0A1F9_9BACT|nr:class I SAM-dependent methyltransferase [Opitutaceae bacterium LMO-M01]WED65743.1 class I SAM-dependent methyltransferase [Opitutaceae bacterium LMO-M01]